LLAQGWWFSPGTPTSSTTKTGCHDIAENGVKTLKSNQIFYTSPDPVSILFKYGFKTLIFPIYRIQSYLPFSRVGLS